SRLGAASPPSSTCPISFRISAIWSETNSRPTPPSRPLGCIAASRQPRSASNSSNEKSIQIKTCHPYKPSASSSICWVSASAPCSRVAPKKSEGYRRDLPESRGGPPAGDRFGRHPASVAGCQSSGAHRSLRAGRQEPSGHPGRRPRFQALGEVDPLRHLPTRSEGVELLLYLLQSDQRLHRGSVGPVVAGESAALPEDPQAVAGPGQRPGESQPTQSVHLSLGAVGSV